MTSLHLHLRTTRNYTSTLTIPSCIYKHIITHICTHARTHAHTRTHTHTCTHTHKLTYTHPWRFLRAAFGTHTHTHTPVKLLASCFASSAFSLLNPMLFCTTRRTISELVPNNALAVFWSSALSSTLPRAMEMKVMQFWSSSKSGHGRPLFRAYSVNLVLTDPSCLIRQSGGSELSYNLWMRGCLRACWPLGMTKPANTKMQQCGSARVWHRKVHTGVHACLLISVFVCVRATGAPRYWYFIAIYAKASSLTSWLKAFYCKPCKPYSHFYQNDVRE
jgi:hypothetical protein